MTSLMFWNLWTVSHELRAGDETRWRQQVAVVRRHAPDVLCVTEGWGWDLDDRALFERAKADLGYPHGVLHEAKTGCHMAVLWCAGITLLAEHHQPHAESWWHGYYRVVLEVPDQPRPLAVVGTHLNPFDPTLRRIESSWLRVALPASDHGVLVMDANTVAPGDPEPEPGPSTHQLGSETADRTPLAALAAAGLVDVGAALGDRSPTTGHLVSDERGVVDRAMRLDQAWVTPSVQVRGYAVVRDPETETASDHRPILLEL